MGSFNETIFIYYYHFLYQAMSCYSADHFRASQLLRACQEAACADFKPTYGEVLEGETVKNVRRFRDSGFYYEKSINLEHISHATARTFVDGQRKIPALSQVFIIATDRKASSHGTLFFVRIIGEWHRGDITAETEAK